MTIRPTAPRTSGPQVSRPPLVDPYLGLLERALTHTLYDPIDCGGPERNPVARRLRELARSLGFVAVRVAPGARFARDEGQDWPVFAQTMVGTKRLSHLRACVERIICEEVPGDLIETGVWRGGASIMMRGVLCAHGVTDRSVWLADSFAGVPAPRAEHPADFGVRAHKERQLAVPRAEVEEHFRRYGLLDDQVRFLEGLFSETLPTLSGHQWALLRLDGDLYGSTLDALTNLYPSLSPGGYVIIDDFGAMPMCRKAVEDFRAAQGIVEPIHRIDWTGVYWRRAHVESR
jgi:O-methyltransferase